VIKISEDVALVDSLDFFTPIVDEPEIQGQIAACNVTNDLYAMAVTRIVNVLAIMGYPQDMPTDVAAGMLKGFSDFCEKLNTKVIGGHTILNPWPIMGGCAVGMGNPKQIIYTRGAKPGDVLVLTKPLGIQAAMAAYRLGKDKNEKAFLRNMPLGVVDQAIAGAIEVMTTSNKPVAEVMQEVNVNAATDITGFGLKGHAENMAKLSHADIKIAQLPVIKGAPALSELLGYALLTGEASETAGGMLIAVSKNNVDNLLDKFDKRKIQHFEIGHVAKGSGNVKLAKKVKITEV